MTKRRPHMTIGIKTIRLRFIGTATLLTIILLSACTRIPVKKRLSPYSEQELSNRLTHLKKQTTLVQTYYSLGRIEIQAPDAELEADVLIIGAKAPLQLKLEVTHLWGRPLFHMLLDGSRVKIVSFPEKRYYVEEIHQYDTFSLLPVSMAPEALWSLGRGFPELCSYHCALSEKPLQISLFDDHHCLQLIDFHAEKNVPFRISFPEKGMWVSFGDYIYAENIQYAKTVKTYDQATDTTIKIDIKRTIFNKRLDKAVFDLIIPPDFEAIKRKPHP